MKIRILRAGNSPQKFVTALVFIKTHRKAHKGNKVLAKKAYKVVDKKVSTAIKKMAAWNMGTRRQNLRISRMLLILNKSM